MIYQEFIEIVIKMREAQKEYFRTKSGISLTLSKKLEKEVDEMLSTVSGPVNDSQSKLF